MVFHREEHSSWFSCTKWSAQKTCIQVALDRKSKLYNEKIGHGFEEEHREAWEGLERRKDRRNYLIKL